MCQVNDIQVNDIQSEIEGYFTTEEEIEKDIDKAAEYEEQELKRKMKAFKILLKLNEMAQQASGVDVENTATESGSLHKNTTNARLPKKIYLNSQVMLCSGPNFGTSLKQQ